jgi:hypothetical protein
LNLVRLPVTAQQRSSHNLALVDDHERGAALDTSSEVSLERWHRPEELLGLGNQLEPGGHVVLCGQPGHRGHTWTLRLVLPIDDR